MRCLAGVVLWAAAACAPSPLVPEGDGGYRHRERGFAIGVPPEREPPWRRTRIEGSDLAYQLGDGEVMSLRTLCREPQAPPEILARHLRIGVGRHVVRSEGPVSLRGAPGWRQTFDVGADGGTVRVAAVTLIDGACTVDFVLSARDGFEAIVPDFDAWWQSYQPAQAAAVAEAP